MNLRITRHTASTGRSHALELGISIGRLPAGPYNAITDVAGVLVGRPWRSARARGLPFALPIADAAGLALFWAQAGPTISSPQITAVITATAYRVAVHDPAIANHPWLARATDYCFAAIQALDAAPHALVLNALGRDEARRPGAALGKGAGDDWPAYGSAARAQLTARGAAARPR